MEVIDYYPSIWLWQILPYIQKTWTILIYKNGSMLGEIIAALLAKIMLRCRAILILKITVYCLLISIHDGSPILFFQRLWWLGWINLNLKITIYLVVENTIFISHVLHGNVLDVLLYKVQFVQRCLPPWK